MKQTMTKTFTHLADALALVLAVAAVTGGAGLASPAGAVQSVAGASGPTSSSGARPSLYGRELLCQIAYRVNELTVTRNKPPNRETFSIPALIRVKKVANIQAAARALCARPVMPKGMQCTVDLGVVYTFNFTSAGNAGGELADPASLRATGCETVTGLGTTRWAATLPNFWGVLGNALGLRSATQKRFAGTIKDQ